MKRPINGIDILMAIGEIDEKLLAYPTKPRTRATIFKKLAVACVTVAICATLVFAAIDQGIIGPPMLDKNDGAPGGDGNSMMGGSDNENSAPGEPSRPDDGDNESNAYSGALRIEKDGSFESYTQNGNNYLHLELYDGVLRIMVSTELDKPAISISDEFGRTVYNPVSIESGYYIMDLSVKEKDVIEIYVKDKYTYIFEVAEATDTDAILEAVLVKIKGQ
jgi:hypothetical protein